MQNLFPKTQPPPVYSVKKKVSTPGEARSYHQILNIVEKLFIILPMNQPARVRVWHCLGISVPVLYLSVFIHSSGADNRSKEAINSRDKMLMSYLREAEIILSIHCHISFPLALP